MQMISLARIMMTMSTTKTIAITYPIASKNRITSHFSSSSNWFSKSTSTINRIHRSKELRQLRESISISNQFKSTSSHSLNQMKILRVESFFQAIDTPKVSQTIHLRFMFEYDDLEHANHIPYHCMFFALKFCV